MKLAPEKINDELAEQVDGLKWFGDLLMKTFDGQARVTEINRYMEAMSALEGEPSKENLMYAREAVAELRRYVDLLTRVTMTALADAKVNDSE